MLSAVVSVRGETVESGRQRHDGGSPALGGQRSGELCVQTCCLCCQSCPGSCKGSAEWGRGWARCAPPAGSSCLASPRPRSLLLYTTGNTLWVSPSTSSCACSLPLSPPAQSLALNFLRPGSVGFGAVGTVYGYVLSQNKDVRVTAIARSSYEQIKDGIDFRSDKFGHVPKWKPHRIVRDAEEANDRPYKYILCATKCLPDLLPTASILAPFLDSKHADTASSVDLEDGPTVVLLQNGIGVEDRLALAYPHVPIISVVVWVGANLLPGGVVTHGRLENLIMGLYTGEGGLAPGDTPEGAECACARVRVIE